MTEDEFLLPPIEPESEVAIVAAPEGEPDDVASSEVAYVVPAAVYQSIATDDEAAAIPEASTVDFLAPTLEAISSLGEGLNRKLDALQTVFDREIRAEATREKVVDRLHAELQEYKQGLLLGILKPVFVDLIQLHDDMGKMIASQSESEGEVARLLGLIQGFQQGIEDILYRQGVEPFAQDGDAFDPRRQRALSTIPTDDPTKNKQVATRLRKGFQAGDKVIRPEMVTVYSYKEKPATAPDAS
jgi:molecular chaperone GrpE